MTNTVFFNGPKNQRGYFVPSLAERYVKKESSEVVYVYLPEAKENEVINAKEVKELTFYEMLNPIREKQLRQYLKTHRLSESEEYQMIVSLGMEMADEQAAERIISGYIRRYGLRSLKARQALVDLDFTEALRVLKVVQKSDEELEEEPTVGERLRDGFLLLKDDDIADRGIFITYWGEPAQA